MPELEFWESLLQVELILDRLEIDSRLAHVLEIGCGYGTFSVPVARKISGRLTALDIEPEMVALTRARAEKEGLDNLIVLGGDAHGEGFGVPDASQDACLLFNILHGEDPEILLTRAAHAVRPGGEVMVIHWRYDSATPRGPALDIRPRPEEIIAWAQATNTLEISGGVIDLPPWHYGLRFEVREGQ